MTDLYTLLGVAKTADRESIRQAYRKLAKTAHPDAGGDEERFRAISLAHTILTDPERREKYDATGEIDTTSVENEQAQIMEVLAQFSG